MKKYLGLIFPLVLPYVFVLGMGGILFFDGKIFEIVFNKRFDIFLMSLGGLLIISLLSVLVTAICAVTRKWEPQEVSKVNMIVKIFQIPAYVMIFIAGMKFSLSMIFMTPFAGILFVVFDCMVIFMTGAIGTTAVWRCHKEGFANKTTLLLLAVGQFIFCVDVVCAILLFITAGKKKALRAHNSCLTANEISWINKLLDCDFNDKEQVIMQINHAEVKKEYNEFFISIQFDVDKAVDGILNSERVPVEMRAYCENKAPIQFLLHIIDGYVAELEIFSADSSPVCHDLKLDDCRIEYIMENKKESTVNNLKN